MPSISRRATAFLVVASLAALGFLRLGFWQLARLGERRADNAVIRARLDQPPTEPAALLADSQESRFRRVRFTGRYDYDREFVLTARSRDGAPGLSLITPLRLSGGLPAVLVNRGWVYAADGMTVDRALWREDTSGVVEGFAETFPEGTGPVFVGSDRGVRRLARDSLAAHLGYPLAPFYVVQQLTRNTGDSVAHPHRLAPLALDEGPHRSYALQWFAFAAIAIIGGLIVVRRELQSAAGKAA